jgi:hypothetical protein
MRDSHRVAGLKPATAIRAAGLAAGVVLAGGISTVPALGPHVPGDVAASRPLAPGVAAATLTSVDIPTQQPPPTGPRAIVITDNPGDGHGPRAVVVTGGDLGNPHGPKAIVISDPSGPDPGPKAVVIAGGGPPL